MVKNGKLRESIEVIDFTGAGPRRSPKSEAVLAAAEELERTGFAVTVPAIADRLGEKGPSGVNRVHARIQVLKRQGRWPFGPPEPDKPRYPRTVTVTPNGEAAGAAPPAPSVSTVAEELDAMETVSRLDPETRRRVIRWLADRFGN